jgi:Ti-type conjugative transfer relaxase TraA
MAIYHFTAKVISRGGGRSAVAAAAYRSGSELEDKRLDRSHDFSNKPGVVHSEVMLPENAPERWRDREVLWNEVEATETRKDAQLAREVEFALPREMSQEQAIELASSFVQREFVERGMVADLNVHWDIGADGLAKPHAHVMLTMRAIERDELGRVGFGKKVREWNSVGELKGWRAAWAEHVNERCRELGIEAMIDHRTLEAQGIELEPQNKIGPAGQRREERGEEAERADEHRAIARRNGERIIAEPALAFGVLTRQQATFTRHDMARLAHRHSDGLEQFNAVMGAVEASSELIRLGEDARGIERFTSRDMIRVEARLEQAAERLAAARDHGVAERVRGRVLAGGTEDRTGDEGLVVRLPGDGLEFAPSVSAGRSSEGSAAPLSERSSQPGRITLSEEQETAYRRVTGPEGLSLVIGYAGTGKSTMLGAAREVWERGGYQVRGGTLSGIAAEGLQAGSGIESRTLASWEHAWGQERERLTARDVLVIDEAGLVGSRQMERVLSHAAEAGAKVVMVGDAEQLQAIEAGAAFRVLTERHGAAEIREVRRQRHDWQRRATRELATGRTAEALARYSDADRVHARETQAEARSMLVERWNETRRQEPETSQIILAYTRDDVKQLNELARAAMREAGALGPETSIPTERGERMFAAGDRLMFLRNERSLGVKNGTLGTVMAIEGQDSGARLTVKLDAPGSHPARGDGDPPSVLAFDVKDYAHLEHGYAATIHKAQGVTVDQTHVLASQHMDRHAAYVALTRHRESVDLYWSAETFKSRERMVRTLSQERAKDSTLDYQVESARDAELLQAYPIISTMRDLVNEVGFMDRREIRVPEATKERVLKTQAALDKLTALEEEREERQKGIDTDRAFGTAREMIKQKAGAVELMTAAIVYTRAYDQALTFQDLGLASSPAQRATWDKAITGMNRIDPQLTRDLKSALDRDPPLFAKAHQNDTRMEIVMAMMTESRDRARSPKTYKPAERQRPDAQTRARTYINAFQQLQEQRERFSGFGDRDERRAVDGQLQALAGTIKADREAEGILRERGREMGVERSSNLERVLQARDAREAQRQATRENERSRGYER